MNIESRSETFFRSKITRNRGSVVKPSEALVERRTTESDP